MVIAKNQSRIQINLKYLIFIFKYTYFLKIAFSLCLKNLWCNLLFKTFIRQ